MNLGLWKPVDVLCLVMGVVLIVLCADAGKLIGVICGVICLVPFATKHLKLFTLPTPLVVAIVLAAFLHSYGVIMDRYSEVPYYDTITHTLSSTVLGVCVFYAMMCVQEYGGGKVNFSGNGLALFTAMITLTFSVYWEVMEYLSDVLFGSGAQYGPYDTLTDLVCDSMGTLLSGLWVGIYMRFRTTSEVVKSFHIDERLSKFVFRNKDGVQ